MSHAAGLEETLARLAVRPPADLFERVVCRFGAVESVAGRLFVAWTDKGVCAAAAERVVGDAGEFVDGVRQRLDRPVLAGGPPAAVVAAARSGSASRVRFDLRGLSDFEQAVLEATRHIPRGETRPYAWVAGEIGRPRAVRAVGSALGRNPVPVLIPCHRVTRSDGTAGNYGGGPELKLELLRAERVNLDEVTALGRVGVHYLACTTTGIVCLPSCAAVRRAAPAHRLGFGRLAAALRAGFRPCRRCRPDAAAFEARAPGGIADGSQTSEDVVAELLTP